MLSRNLFFNFLCIFRNSFSLVLEINFRELILSVCIWSITLLIEENLDFLILWEIPFMSLNLISFRIYNFFESVTFVYFFFTSICYLSSKSLKSLKISRVLRESFFTFGPFSNRISSNFMDKLLTCYHWSTLFETCSRAKPNN